METMQILITDWGKFSEVWPLAFRYHVGLEIQEFANPDHLKAPQAMLKEVIEKTEGLAVLGMHGPFSDLIPASRDPLIRQVTRDRYLYAGDLAQRIGARHLVLHSGFIPKTYPKEIWLQNSIEFWMDLLEHYPFTGEIHVENVFDDDFAGLRDLIDRVNQAMKADRLSVCLDVGHVNANSSKKFEEWIIGLNKRIRYVHVHNNGGVLDDHWRLDHGTIAIGQVLNLLITHSPNAAWAIETPVDDIEPSLDWLITRGYISQPPG